MRLWVSPERQKRANEVSEHSKNNETPILALQRRE